MRNGSQDMNVNVDCPECGHEQDIDVTVWTGGGDYDVDIPQVDCHECGEILPHQHVEDIVYMWVDAVMEDEQCWA